jgi:predicted transcriptional regulator
MGSIKLRDTTIEVIKNLPQGCTLEEIMYEINLTAQVLEGIEDAEKGNTISTENLLKKIDKWRKK